MKAHVFAHLNNLPLTVIGCHQFKIGPYIRGEKSKRRYSDYFTFQKNFFGEMLDRARLQLFKNKPVINEPPLIKMDDSADGSVYRFSSLPHWDDYFFSLKDHRKLVIELFWNLLKDNIKVSIEQKDYPRIGVHIRMGDFRKLRRGEDFRKVGTVRTPEEYFISMIAAIRQAHGSSLPVSVFTDGYRSEFNLLPKLDNVNWVEGNSDIIDLLLLSKSKIIVTSAGSTFSYWAGFLSDSPIILHPDHIHQPLRFSEENGRFYEGAFDTENPVLMKTISAIV